VENDLISLAESCNKSAESELLKNLRVRLTDVAKEKRLGPLYLEALLNDCIDKIKSTYKNRSRKSPFMLWATRIFNNILENYTIYSLCLDMEEGSKRAKEQFYLLLLERAREFSRFNMHNAIHNRGLPLTDDETKEVSQLSIIKLMKLLETGRIKNKKKILGYLRGICNNCAANFLREGWRTKKVSLDPLAEGGSCTEPEDDPLERIIREEERRMKLACYKKEIKRMREKCRKILTVFFEEGRQAYLKLFPGVAENTLDVWKTRCLKSIAQKARKRFRALGY